MIRKLIVLIAVLAALWAIPATRARIVSASVPVLEKLGPTGEKLLVPMHRWSARHALRELVKELRQDAIEGRSPPEPRAFTPYARRVLETDALDPWGQAYWMERKAKSITVGSSGPDARRNTADDITKAATL